MTTSRLALLAAIALAWLPAAGAHPDTDHGDVAPAAAPAVAVAAAAAPPPGAPAFASPWGRDYFPNVPLTNQDGKTVRFFDDLIAGKVVAVNFIFTRCTDACPLETARLREVRDLLGDRLGKDVFFYSISIDPEHDTPAVLKEYMGRFGIDRPGWNFLTGRKADIDLLRQKLGLYMPELEGTKDHNLSLIVGNQATGRWQKASPFENPHVLANHLGSVLHNWKHAGTVRNDYATAPTRLRQISKGEQLFRTRCATCHAIGGGATGAQRALGPDLAGVVQRRERAWLARWLKEPDRMLAEKDPLATALFAQYGVAMPNLRLNDTEVGLLLAHLDEEDARLGAATPRPAPSPPAVRAGDPPAGHSDAAADAADPHATHHAH
jgi:protein SCO1/2